jgi:hypothetical protein
VFSEAIARIVRLLELAQKNRLLDAYALVGGFAVSVWGVSRATQDIDLAIALGSSDPKSLAEHLGATYEAGDADDPLRGVFRLSLKSEGQEVPVQLILLRPQWADEVFRDLKTMEVLDCAVPVVNWRSLLLMKLYAGGPVDLLDARSILAVRNPSAADTTRLVAQAKTLGIDQELQAFLDQIS